MDFCLFNGAVNLGALNQGLSGILGEASAIGVTTTMRGNVPAINVR